MVAQAILQLSFGLALRGARQTAGLSQEKLALESGLDRTFISLLERGLRQPTLGSMFALAGPLRLEPHMLVMQVEQEVANLPSDSP